MYKTLENAIRSIQKNTIDEEIGEASKKRMKINSVAREEDSRDGEVPTRQTEIQKKVVDEAEDKKKMKIGGKKTEVIVDPVVDTKASGNQMKEEKHVFHVHIPNEVYGEKDGQKLKLTVKGSDRRTATNKAAQYVGKTYGFRSGVKLNYSHKIDEEKDEREYGYEGEMATSQLKSIIQNAEAMLGMLQDGTDLPEWVQSKITLAQDYIMSAKDYLSTEMSEEVEQVVEKLTGKQHKIDVNKNQKIDAHDFELLRKKKKFAESNGVTDSLLDAVKSVVEARKPGQSMQMALAAVAKQKELEDKLKGKSTASSMKKEDIDSLSEEQLQEVLKKSDPAGKWISDFVHSKDPKFAGKTKKERMKMALGAYYGKQRNEEVEQVEEGKWNYPKSMTKPFIDTYLGKTGKDERKARKEWRKKIKAKQHKELMTGKQRNKEVEFSDEELARLDEIAKKFD